MRGLGFIRVARRRRLGAEREQVESGERARSRGNPTTEGAKELARTAFVGIDCIVMVGLGSLHHGDQF